MTYDPESSIPRIHVVREKGKVFCYLDEKLKQRYGPVLLTNNKQGRHLFSISYCIVSMALKYHDMYENEIADSLSRFHCDFLTTLTLNSKCARTVTHFLKDWEINFDQLVQEYEELSCQSEALENYLNLAGAMLHTLPCNVAFAECASDPEGGFRAKMAIENINETAKGEGVYARKAMNQNIALTLDLDLIKELFTNGFDDNNVNVLAFMIMQIIELQSLQRKNQPFLSYAALNKQEIESDVFDIAFASNDKIRRDGSFSEAISKAVNLIDSTKKEVSIKLHCKNYHGIKNTIFNELGRIYSFT